jgi:hypothetical protein
VKEYRGPAHCHVSANSSLALPARWGEQMSEQVQHACESGVQSPQSNGLEPRCLTWDCSDVSPIEKY